MFQTITIGKNDYKCVLNAAACVSLEQKLGKNPLVVFMEGIPKIGDMIAVFHASLQKFSHSVSLEDAYELYDKYIEEGHSYAEFADFVVSLFKASGFITDGEPEAKNA